jgi:hypothetical protein
MVEPETLHMEGEILKLIVSGGSGVALTALLFWLYSTTRAEARAAQERYMAHLEHENLELRIALDDEDEKPTRPLPSADRVRQIAMAKR